MRGKSSSITRRKILRWGATAAAGVYTGHAIPDWAQAGRRQPLLFEAAPLSEFFYGQVQLPPGPMQRQFEQNHELLLNLNEDSLLRPFRVRESLPAPGTEMGGWYSTYAFAPACTVGQWLSALCRMYAVTRDQATYGKIDRMIRGYAATIDPTGKFYQDNRFPSYMYDKLVCGLNEAYVFAKHPTALQVLAQTTDAVSSYLPAHAMPRQETPVLHGEDFSRHVQDESYTLPENLFLTWNRTGNRRYYDLANRFLFNKEYFDPLSRGENVLPGLHAYSHVNALSSAAAAYLALKEDKYFHAARNAFAMVQEQSYATGGWGPSEHFVAPGSGKLGESLNSVHASFETPCGAYAHFKITRYLLRITRDSRYGDSMERVLYNTVLGARPIQPDGTSFYYSDYTFHASKGYFVAKWPCCSGTLPQIAADYRISAYFRDPRGVYVNLYVPSTLNWKSSNAQYSIQQITNYPYESHVHFRLRASSPDTFSIFLRIPEWARGASLTVNGMRDSRELTPGTFAEIRREWKNNDRIEMNLPFSSRLEAVDRQHSNTVALVAGPLVLMTLRDKTQLPVPETPLQPPRKMVRGADLMAARQTCAGAHQWTAGSGVDTLILKPFLDIDEEGYTTYRDISQT